MRYLKIASLAEMFLFESKKHNEIKEKESEN